MSWSTDEGTIEGMLQLLHDPQSTLNGTLTCSSLSGTASYETYVASRRNLDVFIFLSITCQNLWKVTDEHIALTKRCSLQVIHH